MHKTQSTLNWLHAPTTPSSHPGGRAHADPPTLASPLRVTGELYILKRRSSRRHAPTSSPAMQLFSTLFPLHGMVDVHVHHKRLHCPSSVITATHDQPSLTGVCGIAIQRAHPPPTRYVNSWTGTTGFYLCRHPSKLCR
jgi:hypothetical protein